MVVIRSAARNGGSVHVQPTAFASSTVAGQMGNPVRLTLGF